MSAISKIPAGLLGFLGIKNTGQYPADLANQLVPTWDLARLYYGYEFRYNGLISTINAVGQSVIIQVPIGEVWLVHDYSIAVTAGAGEGATFQLCRSPPNSAFVVNITEGVTVAASQQRAVCTRLPEPIVLAPGEQLGVMVYDLTGVVDIYSAYRYTPMSM